MIPTVQAGGNPGHAIRRARVRLAEVEAERRGLLAFLRRFKAVPAPRPTVGVDVEALAYACSAWIEVHGCIVADWHPDFRRLRDAYARARYGTTTTAGILREQARGLRAVTTALPEGWTAPEVTQAQLFAGIGA